MPSDRLIFDAESTLPGRGPFRRRVEPRLAPAGRAAAQRADASRRQPRAALRDQGPVARWLARVGWCFTIVTAAALGFAYLLPQNFWSVNDAYLCLCAVAFAARLMQLHLGVALLLVASVAAVNRRRGLTLLAALVGLWAVGPVAWALLRPSPALPDGPTLRVMSLNVNADNRDANAIDRQVRAANPDVVVLQEFNDHHRALLRDTLEERLPHVHVSTINAGVAIYSRLPMRTSSGAHSEGVDEVSRARCEIEFGGASVAVYGVHVPRFHSLAGVARSRRDLARLLAYLSTDPLPAVVVGDFNFTEHTPNGAALTAAGLRSAHALAGGGIDATWPVDVPLLRHLLALRIDQAFVGRSLTATGFSVGGPAGSDHLPVIADVAWSKPAWPVRHEDPAATAPVPLPGSDADRSAGAAPPPPPPPPLPLIHQ